ncbi:hypothetical protein QYF61_016125 [Mycteria americana]|uniref:Integrase catalytic domain-containing protein n=1 Tax=Mycteria americana TaxID=33587 RepID=A0AAN7N8C5_MYCAM|nr:hypothetical protein QYF61_016125 [Mycteria americana]
MVANALWECLQEWKQSNWQCRGKPIRAAALWQDIAAWVENLVVKVRHVDAHVHKGQATEEHQNNQQVDQAVKTGVAQVDLDWQHKGKRYVLTMVEVTTGWLETYPVLHATTRNTILGLEKQVLWRYGTPERIESDNGTCFRNNLIETWAKEHGIEWSQVLVAVQYAPSEWVFVNIFVDTFDCIKCSMMDAQILRDASVDINMIFMS